MEDKRTPEEIAEKKQALKKRQTAYKRSGRARRLLQIAALTTAGLFAKSTSAEAQGFHYERVNTTQQQAPKQIQYGTPEWAESQGYRYSSRYSQGINHRGMINRETGTWEHHGYLGAWIRPTNQPGVMSVMFLPNDPINEAHLVEEQYSTTAKQMQKGTRQCPPSGPYTRSNVGGIGRILPRGWFLE